MNHPLAAIWASLKSQNFRNAAGGAWATLTYPVLVLFSTPVFIHIWGTDQFGVWMLIHATAQLMGMLNFGLGDAVVKFIAQHHALDESKKIGEISSTTSGLSLVIFAFIAMMGWLLSNSTDYWAVGHMVSAQPLLKVCIFPAFILFRLKFLEQSILSVYQGFKRYDLAALWLWSSKTAILTGNLLLAIMGFPFFWIFYSSAIILTIFVLIEIGVSFRYFSDLDFWPAFRKERIRSIFGFGIWTWIQSTMNILSLQADKLLLAFFGGMEMVGLYSIGTMLTLQLHAVYSALVAWVFPLVSAKHAKGESMVGFYRRVESILLTTGLLSMLVLLLSERSLLHWWLGGSTAEKALPFVNISLYLNLFLLLNILPNYFLNAGGQVKTNTALEAIGKLAQVAGMILGYWVMGPLGLLWGSIGALFVVIPLRFSKLRQKVLHIGNPFCGFDVVIYPAMMVVILESGYLPFRIGLSIFSVILFLTVYLKRLVIQEDSNR